MIIYPIYFYVDVMKQEMRDQNDLNEHTVAARKELGRALWVLRLKG